MEKNDIFDTNLLQLPLKAQVADEGGGTGYCTRCRAHGPCHGRGACAGYAGPGRRGAPAAEQRDT